MKKTTIILSIVTVVLVCALTFTGIKLHKLESDFNVVLAQGECVKISSDPVIYAVARKGNEAAVFNEFMSKNGWKYLEEKQLGALFFYEKDGEYVSYVCTYQENYVSWEQE